MGRARFLVLGILSASLLQVTVVRAQAPAANVRAAQDGLALTPPMGWYPWNEFGQDPQNEKLIRQIVDALIASGMKEAGYAYVGPDEGRCFSRGAEGKLTDNFSGYPSGLRGLGDSIHERGLKYALYTDAGTRTCSKAMPGTKDHEFEDMASFAAWRADYVKIDWCNTEGQVPSQSYSKLRDAQLAAGRPIVFSLCSWGWGEPWKWAAAVGHLWRTTADICGPGEADWNLAMKNTAANEKLYAAAGPGHWNDPDMLITGMDGLSETQNRSFFSLWCIMAAPLMAGNDLRKMTAATIQILTNREAIAIDQDPLGVQGHIVRREGQAEIWAGKRLFDSSQAVLVFNAGSGPAQVHVAWSDLGADDSAAMYVRDLWRHQTAGPLPGGTAVTVAPNDAAFLRVATSSAFPAPPIIVADSYRLAFRATASGARKLSRSITVKTTGTDELPRWKVHEGIPSWLSVKVTKHGKSQTFNNTVSAAGLAKGAYHAEVRADNVEPRSGLPMSALYYDVDLEVADAAGHPVAAIQFPRGQ